MRVSVRVSHHQFVRLLTPTLTSLDGATSFRSVKIGEREILPIDNGTGLPSRIRKVRREETRENDEEVGFWSPLFFRKPTHAHSLLTPRHELARRDLMMNETLLSAP